MTGEEWQGPVDPVLDSGCPVSQGFGFYQLTRASGSEPSVSAQIKVESLPPSLSCPQGPKSAQRGSPARPGIEGARVGALARAVPTRSCSS